LSTTAGDSYSLNDGDWQSSNVFSGLTAGSNPSIKVKNAGGCISEAALCSDASVCEPPLADGKSAPTGTSSKTDISGTSTNTQPQAKTVVTFSDPSTTSVKAFPNPFSDRVKFVITSSTAGQAHLDLYNYLGQKIRTVYSGQVHVGTQTIELQLPVKQSAQMMYILRMGDKKITGKLLQVNQ
jgi:hypothetical protein